MPPSNTKANYKTYEAQARLVRAIVAAHPDVKWNYKDIVACYGSDMTEHALNHRFRRLRAQAVIIREGRRLGLDMKDLTPDGNKELPVTQEAVDKNNIAKYFGQSTPDGIHFQFRTIKKDADQLRQVAKDGGDVAGCLSLGGGSSVLSTPSKPTPARGAGSRSGTGSSRKRRRVPAIKRSSSDEEDDDIEVWSDNEVTPTKQPTRGAFPGQKTGTPTRRAAVRASATIAEAAAGVETSSSEDQPERDSSTPTHSNSSFTLQATTESSTTTAPVSNPPASIFGPADQKPFIPRNYSSARDYRRTSYARTGADYLAGGGDEEGNAVRHNPYSELGDGEF